MAMAMVLFHPCIRFMPDDEELVDFLQSKAAGELVLGPIHELDVYGTEPWNLTVRFEHGEMSNKAYFFSPRNPMSTRGGGKGSRVNRNAGAGFWHSQAHDVKIMVGSRLVGHKTALNFRMRDGSKCPGGDEWIMHEYRLAGGFQPIALCRIYKKTNPNSNRAPPAQDQHGEPPSKRAQISSSDETEPLALTAALHPSSSPSPATLETLLEDDNFAAMEELKFTADEMMAGWGDLYLQMAPRLTAFLPPAMQPSPPPPPPPPLSVVATPPPSPAAAQTSSLTAALASLEGKLFPMEDEKELLSSEPMLARLGHLYHELETLVQPPPPLSQLLDPNMLQLH